MALNRVAHAPGLPLRGGGEKGDCWRTLCVLLSSILVEGDKHQNGKTKCLAINIPKSSTHGLTLFICERERRCSLAFKSAPASWEGTGRDGALHKVKRTGTKS
jgi:hypothetical protein